MSYDDAAAQKAFRDGQNFEFRLIADTDREISRAFGASLPDDHQYKDWPRRITYLIDPGAKVEGAWEVKDVKAHADEVLAVLKSKSA